MHALIECRGVAVNDVVYPNVPGVMPVGFARPGWVLALLLLAGATQAAQVA
jgi:hypothetical protein